MELEILQVAMTEQLQEQQAMNQRLVEVADQLKLLTRKVEQLSTKPDPPPPVIPKPDMTKVELLLDQHLDKVRQIVQSVDKPIIRQWRFLLFPETNAGHYYKIVFARLIPWGLLFAGCCYVFALAGKYIDSSSRIKERQYYYEVYQDAWNQLDTMLNASGRKKMHEAIQRAQAKQ